MKKILALAVLLLVALAAWNVSDLLEARPAQEAQVPAQGPREEALRQFGPEVVRLLEGLQPGHEWDGSAAELQVLRHLRATVRAAK